MTQPTSITIIATVAVALAVSSPSSPATAQSAEAIQASDFAAQHGSFDTYWYQGLAELDRYSLTQSRYGELHDGEAVLIYVTEDFHRELQVKWDHGDPADADPIIKLNAYRRFYTGVYPYTILTSVFAPVRGDNPNPFKISSSTQEWCGHAYSQLNRRDGQYDITIHSYFQNEADQSFSIPETTTEDELFTRLRRDPGSLPVGSFSVVPAAHYLRLMHRPTEAVSATGTLEAVDTSPHGDAPAQLYTLSYTTLNRELRIWFEPQFPHRVLAWEEEQPGLGSGEPLTTRAVLTDSIMLDYWRHHDNDDAAWRDILGLTM